MAMIGAGRPAFRTVLAAVLLAGSGAAGVEAADAPSLHEILGKAQSQSERKAVEELIDKLQGQARPAEAGAPPPAAAAPAPASPAPAAQPSARAGAPSTQEAAREPAAPSSGETPSATASAPPAAEPVIPAGPAAPAQAAAPLQPAPAEQPAGATASGHKIAAPQPEPGGAPAMSPETAVAKAERQELPSVDLEVYFDFNSAEITPQAVAILTTLGRALTDPRLAGDEFLIAGHTDAKGRADYNRRLSQRRAEAVRGFLIAHFGVEASRLTAKGFGPRRLKDPHHPRAAENRRVQVVNVSASATARVAR